MATDIATIEGLSGKTTITQLFRGADRGGIGLQITQGNSYVSLSPAELRALVTHVGEWLARADPKRFQPMPGSIGTCAVCRKSGLLHGNHGECP